jgi:hypothetical protein
MVLFASNNGIFLLQSAIDIFVVRLLLTVRVAEPNPDAHVFDPPGSGSMSNG